MNTHVALASTDGLVTTSEQSGRRMRQVAAVVLGAVSLVLLLFVLLGADLSGLFLLITSVIALAAAWLLWRTPRAPIPIEQRLDADAAFLKPTTGAFSNAAMTELSQETTSELEALLGGQVIAGALSGRYQIDYEDSKGTRSERTIAVYAIIERSGVVNLDCFSADQISCRTYRADRIKRLTDLDSGAVVTSNIVGWLTTRP